MKEILSILSLFLTLCSSSNIYGKSDIIIIAHRGASGYLPEHTLAGKSLSYGMGADYIEQDVVLTKDDHAIVIHDIYLDEITNVSEVFPHRSRQDGRYYAIDFLLSEIKLLTVTERFHHQSKIVVYPGRFPINTSKFQISTLIEEIELIQGLNKSTGKNVGIYTEIKFPSWHRRQGKDISKIVLNILSEKGYSKKSDNVYIQCFDPIELKRLRHELNSQLKLIQLIDDSSIPESDADYAHLQSIEGLKEIASYANGIAPSIQLVIIGRDKNNNFLYSTLIDNAHRNNLVVHVYTLRRDELPLFAENYTELLLSLLISSRVNGIFTDFPDDAVKAKNKLFDKMNND